MRECPKCELCYADDSAVCPTDQTETRPTLPGSPLLAGRYWIEKRLGRGAMGQVYLARDQKFEKKHVAVKTVRQDILNSDDLQEGEAIARFEREAQSAASIAHPHIVQVTDFGKTNDGIFYLVMEYVEGETLHRLLRREGTLSVKRALGLLEQICDGVEAAHEAGILHRDLKPANIFIMRKNKKNDDEEGFIKVGDFGLAKIVNQTATDVSGNAPASRGIIGTPEFMSPEQMQPDLPVDVRADVYALGTIAYLMLGGKTPFTGDLMQLVMQKMMNTPPPITNLRTDIPKEVEKAVMHALEKDAVNRPESVSAWFYELEKSVGSVSETDIDGKSRLIILAPFGAEVYLDDERIGSVGSSGRIVLPSIPIGKHVLRVSKKGEKDDERVIEIREDSAEQVIQAQLRPVEMGSEHSPSHSSNTPSSVMPDIVCCVKCNARFAAGIKFCGRCGSSQFRMVTQANIQVPRSVLQNQSFVLRNCPRCQINLSPNTKFCGKCGLNIAAFQATVKSQIQQPQNPQVQNVIRPVEIICPKCRASYQAGVKFCGRCGFKFSP